MAKCFICIRDRGKMKKYCPRCRKFVYRAGNKQAHVQALILDYDPVNDVFRCHYTKIPLEEDDTKSPRYLTFEHVDPDGGEKGNVVLTMAVLNESKTDMTYDEYVRFCREVVRAHDGGRFDEKVLDLKHWYRLARLRAGRRK